MTLLIVYITVALGFSFLCSVLEAVLLSVTPSYIAHLESQPKRKKAGRRLRNLKTNIDRPLSAILSLNTIAHTVGAAGAGAQAQEIWGSEILAIASAILTLLILVFSEIIPKTLGATYWKNLAPSSSALLLFLTKLLFPLVFLAEAITGLLKSKSSKQRPSVSREEFIALTKLSAEQGILEVTESRILKNLLKFGNLRTKDVMTPRTVVHMLHHDTTLEDFLRSEKNNVFSRIPIWKINEDDIFGYVLKAELMFHAAKNELGKKVGEFVRPMMVIPENKALIALFDHMLKEREHIALVVDEYGGVEGIVTMEDIVETLLGLEIVDEADKVQDMREMAREQWVKRAMKLGIIEQATRQPAQSTITRHEP